MIQNNVKFSSNILINLEDGRRDLINKHPNGVAKYFYHMIKGVLLGDPLYDINWILTFSTKIFNVLTDNEIKGKLMTNWSD